jgi:soluble lytic murein transglycosylase-like protein
MRPFSIVALFFLGFNAAVASDATLLESIAMVESGQNRKAIGKAGERGMYQVGRDAWDDANKQLKAQGYHHYQWSKWRDVTAQDMIAATHLRWIRENFMRVGKPDPTPEQIAVVWNLGWSASVSRRFAPNDYAIRVGNLFRSQKVLTR